MQNIKNWDVSKLNKDRAADLALKHNIPFFLAMMLEIRGFVSDEQIEEILHGSATLSDPFLMKGMNAAVDRIQSAIEKFEKIAVYGDYDADGITSTSMLVTYLETVGADVMYYIPQREDEGYGLNLNAVTFLSGENVKLIVTVDNGIASIEEIAKARELGIDVVVTDHHRPQDKLPDATAIIDAFQPGCESAFKDFSGAGVVLKLLIAMEHGETEDVLTEYADLAALGTIGDVVPLLGENRTIVKAGMEVIMGKGRVGIYALLSRSGMLDKVLTAKALAFSLIPRINATGRMGKPERAVRLLTSVSPEESDLLAEEICLENDERRRVETEICQKVMEVIENSTEFKYQRILVISGENWHHGVVGIVASRITEHYGKPCMIISSSGEMAKGSGRSIEGFSLFDAVFHCSELFIKFGGHPMAAGITLLTKNIDMFRMKVNSYAKTVCYEMPAQTLQLDCKLNPSSLSVKMPEELLALEPFGANNLTPLFGLFKMKLASITPVGNGNHLRLTLEKNGKSITCMRFGCTLDAFAFQVGDILDLAVLLDSKIYRGASQLSVVIRDIKPSELNLSESIHTIRLYERFKREENITRDEAVLISPTRQDLVELYKTLIKLKGEAIGFSSLLMLLPQKRFNAGKLLISFEVLEERKLMHCEIIGDKVKASLKEATEKTDVYDSTVFQQMKRLI